MATTDRVREYALFIYLMIGLYVLIHPSDYLSIISFFRVEPVVLITLLLNIRISSVSTSAFFLCAIAKHMMWLKPFSPVNLVTSTTSHRTQLVYFSRCFQDICEFLVFLLKL